ncbi:fibrinogen beta chain-like [Asterias amurensis]|uniref:fibrinogen beta chain-like n=1 Tax=Asterias amurensis TaxID=7602 RepID=UPI003AB8C2ED
MGSVPYHPLALRTYVPLVMIEQGMLGGKWRGKIATPGNEVDKKVIISMQIALCILFSTSSWFEFASVSAFSCSFGREPNPKENGIIRWVMPLNHRLRCQCTSIYPGGMNTYTPDREFDPFYTDHPLFTNIKTEILKYFECARSTKLCLHVFCHTLRQVPLDYFNYTKFSRHDCQDYHDDGERRSGVYTIYPSKNPRGFDVYCYMTRRSGWIVIQKRFSNMDFDLGWNEYRDGFGDLNGKSFWLGNEKVRQLTEDEDISWKIQVVVYKQDRGGTGVLLRNFRLSGENYIIHVDSSMNCGNSRFVLSANGKPFSTYDRDTDGENGRNCAKESKGGWWFDGCDAGGYGREVNLNAEHTADGFICFQYQVLYKSQLMIQRSGLTHLLMTVFKLVFYP